MAITVKRALHGAKGKYLNYTPFIISMIDADGNLKTLPYPSQDDQATEDTIYGVELMVNPASISNNMSKVVTRTPTMTAFVEEHWGEELDTLTFQGSTATFVNGGTDIYTVRLHDSNTSPIKEFYRFAGAGVTAINDDEPGITTSQRRASVSYHQFLRLIDIFRSNGCIFDQNGFVKSRLYVFLSYGNEAYRGLFESIDVTEDASNPFRFIYTITFKSEETVFAYTDPGMTWTAGTHPKSPQYATPQQLEARFNQSPVGRAFNESR
jgi:hypothetical protein